VSWTKDDAKGLRSIAEVMQHRSPWTKRLIFAALGRIEELEAENATLHEALSDPDDGSWKGR